MKSDQTSWGPYKAKYQLHYINCDSNIYTCRNFWLDTFICTCLNSELKVQRLARLTPNRWMLVSREFEPQQRLIVVPISRNYPQCLVLVGSRNGVEGDLHMQNKLKTRISINSALVNKYKPRTLLQYRLTFWSSWSKPKIRTSLYQGPVLAIIIR